MVRPVLIMAGGTGGHVFPALAVAKILRERGIAVVWLGTQAGMEARLVPGQGFPIEWVQVGGLRGKGVATLVQAPWKLLRALVQSLAIVRRLRPRVVLGAGGFVTGPGGLAAWLTRVPLIIHEQNAIAGLTNRLLARLAREVYEAFPSSFPPRIAARCVGNPVRAEIAALPPPAVRFAGRAGPARVLVLGGSQGARALNQLVPRAMAQIAKVLPLEIRHQAGERGRDVVREEYAKAQVDATVMGFIDDMAAAYRWADLAICRAGALTITELQAAGLGAILVPFPAAVDDHQTQNAAAMAKAGAAQIEPEREIDVERLAALLHRLLSDRTTLLRMAERARGQARTDAAAVLADRCMALGAAA
jgi:UDP-N-acetylglucosamine--N-acetylmuramyl-(pentapeptide) pyrophosphoryl-undecaprenol N-acetylglucosamine transferase